MEVLLISRVRGGVRQAVRHECAEGDGLTLHHERYVPRGHLGPSDMERQASLPEVHATISGDQSCEDVFGSFVETRRTYRPPSLQR